MATSNLLEESRSCRNLLLGLVLVTLLTLWYLILGVLNIVELPGQDIDGSL